MDDKMRDALEKLAYGYDYEEREVIANKAGKPEKVRVIKRHVPPNLKALERIEYLKRSKNW